MDEKVKVKAKFKGTSRRFEIPSTSTWDELLDELRRLFDLEQKFLVKYCDDENELVFVSSQEELNEAIRLSKDTSRLLYLYIEDPSSRQTNDPSLLEFEERNVQQKDNGNKKGSSCYSDLASAMAAEMSALNLRLEKSAEKQSSKKDSQEASKPNTQDIPQGGNDRKEKGRGASCYSDLAKEMAPELSALNERMAKATQKEKTSLKAEGETQAATAKVAKQNNKKEKGRGASCYSDLATEMAPELSALNERMAKATQKEKKSLKAEGETQAAAIENTVTSTPLVAEAPKSCYINLEEIMSQSKQGDGLDLQTADQANSVEAEPGPQSSSMNIGASRGWYGQFESDQWQQFNVPASQGKSTKKKKKKKQHGCYSALAEAMAPELAKLTVREKNVSVQSKSTDHESENDEIGGHVNNEMVELPVYTLSQPPPPVVSETKRQLESSGQYRKKLKRPRKHDRKKGCYAQLAEDIAPLFGAMNERLKEKQRHETVIQLTTPNTPPEQEPQHDVPLYTSSPGTTSEPFIFVSHGEGAISIEAEGIEIVKPGTPDDQTLDVGPDVAAEHMPSRSLERQSEQNQGSTEPNLINFEEESSILQSPEKSNEEMKEMVKEILEESMDAIVNQAVQRLQTPNTKTPTTPCNTPQGYITPSGNVVHKGITCDHCGTEVIGIRYKCCNCKDFDLCETCEEMTAIHNMEHVFVKLKYPAPGIGRRRGEMVPIFKRSVYKRNCEKKQKEKELRRAAKEAERERKRAIREQKHALKAQEKERKRREKAKKTQCREKTKLDKVEPRKVENSHVHDRLHAGFVCDASFPDGSIVAPGKKFLKNWVVQNDGDIAWNQWIMLECIEGSIMGFPVLVPHLVPGARDVISVEFIAPEIPGTYSSKWQLSYGLYTFGPHLWCEIQVPDSEEGEETVHHDQCTLIDTAFTSDTPTEPDAKLVYETKLQTGNVDDGSSSEYLSSEDTPEADRGSSSSGSETKKEFSLTSAQSGPPLPLSVQQRQDLEWDAGYVYDLVEMVELDPDDVQPPRERRLTESSSVVDSEDSDADDSDSSLDEFTVLIPTCFDPDAPLTADPVPVLVTSIKPEKWSHSFSSPFLNSIEPGSGIELDEFEPSSLPNMTYLRNDEEIIPSDDTHSSLDDSDTTPVHCDAVGEPTQGMDTPSGRISPRVPPPQEAVITEPPVLRQPSISPRGSIPLVTQPSTIAETRQSKSTWSEGETRESNNLVSEVLNTAIDAVAMAGRAAFATVDNLLNGNVQARAVYKPEDDCEVTVNRRTSDSDCDAPPPPPMVWPMNRSTNSAMDRLIEMGFGDRKLNQRLLLKHKDNINATVEELLGHTENDWSSQRH